jgi:hypothetical protein
MDPLSFVIFRRIASKIADGIDRLIDLWDRWTFQRTRDEELDYWRRPGEPSYLPRKEGDDR